MMLIEANVVGPLNSAASIGAWMAACHSGKAVSLLGRPKLFDQVRHHGLTGLLGFRKRLKR
ncbi:MULTISPECIES: hypothetical protein [unclassified Bradyrhizobium]|uniref:hypothetical protein n=1 Tax=unclassified Bradyrhizobium TaxID=2631580 RepID=UPI002FF0C7F0